MSVHVFAVAADSLPIPKCCEMCLPWSPCFIQGASLFVRALSMSMPSFIIKSIRLQCPVQSCTIKQYCREYILLGVEISICTMPQGLKK